MWSFGRKIAAAFALAFLLLVVVGGISYRSINTLTSTSAAVDHTHTVLERLEGLLGLVRDAETDARGFVIVGDESFLATFEQTRARIPEVVQEIRELTADDASQQRRLDGVEALIAVKLAHVQEVIDVRRSGGMEGAAALVQTGEGKKAMDTLRDAIGAMETQQRGLLEERAGEAEVSASSARVAILGGTVLCLLLVAMAGYLLTRSLSTQIGTAVRNVQSSSAELQAAANQQVASAREQATAMTQITTTVSELLATSRQIAESARRVSQIASESGAAARTGDQTVQRTQESVGSIKRQVDVIVGHMLELGKKSQQVGGILEIINELAEQTNILAINATIEAAGAGEAGKRFGVVADEIRKLADRVGGSTKEIRALVEEIRSAVNTTVMATEIGAKAVDAGSVQFVEVAAAFRQIAALVGTTTDAAKEIELSTKQQTSAVEQVNLAVGDVTQSSKESAVSSSQTLQTSSQLSALALDLARVINPATT